MNNTHEVEDGYSPLGTNETLPCPDGTFAFRKILLFSLVCYGQSIFCVKLSTEKDLCIPGNAKNAQVELFVKEETWNFAP